MASHYEAPIRKPLVTGNKSYHDVTVDIVAPVEGKANKQWWIVFSIALVAFLWGIGCIIYTISTGIGVWGLNKTVGWAWERSDGGRSVGYSGLHFHVNWRHEQYRRLVAQAVLWTLKLPVPNDGLKVNLDPKVLELK